VFLELAYDIQYVSDVFFFCPREDNNVIQVDHGATIDEFTQDIIHHALKGSGSICEAEGHYAELIVTVPTGKCSLLLGILS